MRYFLCTIGLAILGFGMIISLYADFIASPPEAQMGNVVRIMYFHIPSAVMAFLAIGISAVLGVFYLLKRNLVWDRLSASSAVVGLLFTSFVLITGSIWGASVWNTWWTWDPTLTTTLILWFLYVAYFLLRSSITDMRHKATISAVYGLIAAGDIPVIKQSVTWWSGLHPTVISEQGIHMPPIMIDTLLVSIIVFAGVYGLVFWMVDRLTIQKQFIRKLRQEMMDFAGR